MLQMDSQNITVLYSVLFHQIAQKSFLTGHVLYSNLTIVTSFTD